MLIKFNKFKFGIFRLFIRKIDYINRNILSNFYSNIIK